MKKDMVILITEKQQLTKGVMSAFCEEMRDITYGILPSDRLKLLQDSCYWASEPKGATPHADIRTDYSIGRSQPHVVEYRKGIFRSRIYITSVTSEGAVLSTDLSVGEWGMLTRQIVDKLKDINEDAYKDLMDNHPNYVSKVDPNYEKDKITSMLAAC